ncbi:MAG: hypothetical protein ABID87_05470 [Chloroflexota bacterium]
MGFAILPLISSIVSLLFALVVFDQFLARRKPYQLIWALGLLMYCISTATEFWTETWGLNLFIYRTWYLVGAIFVAAYLGMGTIYLLAPRRVAHAVMAALLLASVYATLRVATASIDLTTISSLSGKAMPGGVRMLTPFFNTFGTLALVGGAAYSAWVFWRKKILPHRVISNVLIAIGAILPAFGGIHIRFGGEIPFFYLFEMVGIILIFTGFLRSREVFGIYRLPLMHGFGRISTA